MYTTPTVPESIITIWRKSLLFYKNIFVKIWGFIISIILLNILFQPQIYQPKFMQKLQQAQQSLQSNTTPIDFTNFFQQIPKSELITMMALSLIAALIWIFIEGALLHRIYNLTKNPQATLKETFKVVANNYIKILFASIIMLSLIIIGLILFIIPGIFLAALLTFTLPFVLFEGKNVFKAFTGSSKLVWGNWWRTFITILLPFGIATIILNHLIIFLLHSAKLPIVADVVDAVAFSILLSIIQTFVVVLFYDLKLRKAQKAAKKNV